MLTRDSGTDGTGGIVIGLISGFPAGTDVRREAPSRSSVL